MLSSQLLCVRSLLLLLHSTLAFTYISVVIFSIDFDYFYYYSQTLRFSSLLFFPHCVSDWHTRSLSLGGTKFKVNIFHASRNLEQNVLKLSLKLIQLFHSKKKLSTRVENAVSKNFHALQYQKGKEFLIH
jgi:hypothetical protein